jgi:hypothetical protein
MLALLGAATALVHAAPGDVDLSARVEPSQILVGEPIRYLITVTRPVRMRAELPAVRGNTGRLDVEGYRVSTGTAPDGRVQETHTLSLTAWMAGDDTLPSQRVEVRSEGDTNATVFYTPPTAITVRATAPQDPKAAIADIRDRERLPKPFPWGLPLLAAAMAALWYAIRRYRRRPKPAPAPLPAPTIAPEEKTLARLRELEQAALPPREFAFALSEILRAWLSDRFAVDALEATTEELRERVKPLRLSSEHDVWLREFCESLDRVKFADATFAAGEGVRRINETREFVHETAATLEPAKNEHEVNTNEGGPA